MRKAKAYAEASAVVIGARQLESDSQNILLTYLQNVASKWYINTPDMLVGLGAGYLDRQTTLKSSAARFGAIADEVADIATDRSLGPAQQAESRMVSILARTQERVHLNKAEASRVGKWLERLPEGVRNRVFGNLKEFIPNNVPYLNNAVPALRKIPIGGTFASVGSVAVDIYQGKDAGVAVASAGSGLVAGTVAGAAIGGPLGAVAGFIVSTGVSFSVEEWGDDVAKYVVESDAGRQ